jgi:hypothetical protein
MTNSQAPMTKEFPMTNDELAPRARPFSSFVLGHSLVIRAWEFVIRGGSFGYRVQQEAGGL